MSIGSSRWISTKAPTSYTHSLKRDRVLYAIRNIEKRSFFFFFFFFFFVLKVKCTREESTWKQETRRDVDVRDEALFRLLA